MRENTIRTIWQRGGCVVNGWLSIPDGFAAELNAHQGWDSLTIDLQHGLVDYQAAVRMLQGISTTSVIPLARVQSARRLSAHAAMLHRAIGVLARPAPRSTLAVITPSTPMLL